MGIVIFSIKTQKNRQRVGILYSRMIFEVLEREKVLLSRFPFRPSVRFGPRGKAVLCGEGYTWTLIWWSSDNSKR